jgi:hypothetical protein
MSSFLPRAIWGITVIVVGFLLWFLVSDWNNISDGWVFLKEASIEVRAFFTGLGDFLIGATNIGGDS